MNIYTLHHLHKSGEWPEFWAEHYDPDHKHLDTLECVRLASKRWYAHRVIALCLFLIALIWTLIGMGIAMVPYAPMTITVFLGLISLEYLMTCPKLSKNESRRALSYLRDVRMLSSHIKMVLPGIRSAQSDMHSKLIELMTGVLRLERKISEVEKNKPIDWKREDTEKEFKEAHRLARAFTLTKFTAEEFRDLPYMQAYSAQATG